MQASEEMVMDSQMCGFIVRLGAVGNMRFFFAKWIMLQIRTFLVLSGLRFYSAELWHWKHNLLIFVLS